MISEPADPKLFSTIKQKKQPNPASEGAAAIETDTQCWLRMNTDHIREVEQSKETTHATVFDVKSTFYITAKLNLVSESYI